MSKVLDIMCKGSSATMLARGQDYFTELDRAREQCAAPRGRLLVSAVELGSQEIRLRLHYELNRGLR